MSNEQASLLVMAFYDGEYTGEAGPLTHICVSMAA
jgi:hypothetical protein